MSAFNATKAGVNSMKRGKGGSIVLFSSSVAKHGIPNHEAIASAKGAVQGLMLSAAATYANKNIRINCVSPGMVRPVPRCCSSEPGLDHSMLAVLYADLQRTCTKIWLANCRMHIKSSLVNSWLQMWALLQTDTPLAENITGRRGSAQDIREHASAKKDRQCGRPSRNGRVSTEPGE